MITKQTKFDLLRIDRDGNILIRFTKEIVEDGKVIASEYHRTSILPGQDLTFTMQQVNAHLASMGKEQVQAGELSKVAQIIPIFHTKAVIDEYKEKLIPPKK